MIISKFDDEIKNPNEIDDKIPRWVHGLDGMKEKMNEFERVTDCDYDDSL